MPILKLILSSLALMAFVLVGGADEIMAEESALATPELVEQQVREVFADTSDMIEIARCESKFRQFTDAGNVLRGGYGGQMVGVFQLYESVHASAAEAQGYDLATLSGNIAYAEYLYNKSGTTPWNSSADCWQGVRTSTTYTLTSDTTAAATEAELREKISLLTQLLTLLQTLLALQMNE